MRYIGLDVGTSSCKASVMDGKGHIFASSAYSYPLIYTNEGFVEISPDAIWQSSTRALKDIAMKSRDAKALAVSSLGETMVILGANDRPVTNGIVYLDQRCKRELSEIITRINPRDLYAKTLVPLNQMFSLCKILWYQKNAPWILRDGKKIFLVSDYINYMLSGNRAIDPSMASRTMFFDANELKWSKEIADLFDLPIDKFSEIAKAGTYIGTILPKVASEIGLPVDLKILTGTHDQVAATIGSGALNNGDTVLGEGTSEGINIISEKRMISSDYFGHGICFEPYLEPEKYILCTGQSAHGISVDWFINLFKNDYVALKVNDQNEYTIADDLCSKKVSNIFFLPYLSGTSVSESGNNASGCFIGLGLTTERNDLYRAVLEGLSFETRRLIDDVQHFGTKLSSITATGGGTKSYRLMQIKSDILRKKINTLKNKESGINGLCMICAVACGEFSNYRDSVEQNIRIGEVYTPKNDLEDKYLRYLQIRESILNLYQK